MCDKNVKISLQEYLKSAGALECYIAYDWINAVATAFISCLLNALYAQTHVCMYIYI